MLYFVFQEELVDPAVKGTLNVLRSCAKSPSVRRVVITSSTASVICNKNMSTPGAVADETWYSDPEFCEERKVLCVYKLVVLFNLMRLILRLL